MSDQQPDAPAPDEIRRLEISAAAGDALIREILEALCLRDGLPLESSVVPGEPARNYDLAIRLGIGRVFGIGEPDQGRDGAEAQSPGIPAGDAPRDLSTPDAASREGAGASADDPREPLGRVFHEQGRLTVNAEREKPFGVQPWEDRTDEQREIDMRGASAVAVQAAADAKLDLASLRAEVARLRAGRDRVIRELGLGARRAVPGVERKALLAAVEVAMGTEPAS